MITEIHHNGNHYGVFIASFKKYDIPVVIDKEDIDYIEKYSTNWNSNMSGSISCAILQNSDRKYIKLHHLIATRMRLTGKIIHVNRILLDNRRENLITHCLSHKKRQRRTKLPPNCGINVDDLPTYVWYSRADKSHSDRFVVKIGDIVWKTTSSKKVSLKYKLEAAKYFLRELKKQQPELFSNVSLNGDMTEKGLQLMESFHKIVSLAGIKLNKISIPLVTNKLLKPQKLNTLETQVFENNVIQKKNVRTCPIKDIVLQKYCYYCKANKFRGECFIIRIPNQKIWISSTSNNKAINEKYTQLVEKLKL